MQGLSAIHHHHHHHVQLQQAVAPSSSRSSNNSCRGAMGKSSSSCRNSSRRAVGCCSCAVTSISASSSSSSSSYSVPSSLREPGNERQEDIVIVGGGIAGLSTALALHRLGLKPLVLEQSKELKTAGSSIGIWTNGWKALEALRVADGLREKFNKMSGLGLYDSNGNCLLNMEMKITSRDVEVRAVDRKALLEALREPLPESMLSYGADVVGIRKLDSDYTEVECKNGWRIKTKVLIGCDGSSSVVARWMGFKEPRFVGYTATRGLVEFPDGHNLQQTGRQITGRGVRAGLIPMDSNRLYWFVCFNDASGQRINDPELVRKETLSYIRGWSDEAISEAVKRTPCENLSRRRIADRWMWPVGGPPLYQGGITLAGDAMHPITPNLGQGGCCALEDAVVLARALSEAINVVPMDGPHYERDKVEQALDFYTRERRQRMLPIGIRSYVIGSLLQNENKLFCYARNLLIPKIINADAYLNHTFYDCGSLD